MWPFSRTPETPSTPPQSPLVTTEVATNQSVTLERENHDIAREFVRSIYLWRSIDMIGQMSSSIPMVVQPEKDRALTAQEKQVQDLLRNPNPQWTGAALQYFATTSLAVVNRAFFKRVRGVGNVTIELWPLTPTEVTVNYRNGTRVIDSFTVNAPNKSPETFKVADNGDCDIIFVHRPALNKSVDKSPAAIAAAPAEVFTRILQRCADIVSNSSNITGLLSTEQELAKNAVLEIKDRINQFKTGSRESGGTLVTANAKWTLTRLSEDPSSALSVEIKDSIARDVVMTFGVPTQLVGLPGTDTYNNLALARVGFLTDTILPGYISLYVAAMNLALMPKATSLIIPDLHNLPAMIAGRLQLTETASKATMLSVNEQRALLGYPAYDDETANVPIILETMNLKRLAIEVQGGNVANILESEDR